MKVILKASEIPLNSTVTKPTGIYKYTITDRLTVHGDTKTEILAKEGTRFLTNNRDTASINCIPGCTELVWHAEPRDVLSYLEDLLDEEEAI